MKQLRAYDPKRPNKRKRRRNRRICACLSIVLVFVTLFAVKNALVRNGMLPVFASSGDPSINNSVSGNGYRALDMPYDDIYVGDLVLINSQHDSRFTNNDSLVSLFDEKTSSYKVKDTTVLLDRDIVPYLNNMLDDLQKQLNNNNITIVSGYRTRELQQTLYDNKVQKEGQDEAQKWVALPGASEHHSGLALDFSIIDRLGITHDYTGEGDYSWLNQNAYQYGFIVRYPSQKTQLTEVSYEPWHFRYVGYPHSYLIQQKGMCFEEYIDYLRQFEYQKQHLEVTFQEQNYEIYFVKANPDKSTTKVFVPQNKEYWVSGNNVDGFLVTVKL